MAHQPKLRLYNTLTKVKEDFVPLDASNVRMYVCGPTVYDFAHIGNARPVIVFDVLYRLLRHLYGEKHVTYVRNITDIDDKINKRAFDRWTKKRPLLDEVKALTEVTAKQYEDDVAALGCLPPTHSPRATDFVCNGSQSMDMVRVIEKLVAKGHAYEAEGHVLFHVPSMPNYGKLSRRTLDDMIAGARVEVAPYKRDPMDFVLWKPSDAATEPGWDSPWGFGRPGWHIECSAMSGALLGEQFDIHAGGIDLIFPHHENEIAQTCCAFGVEKMASVWMHNGFLQVEGQKMSKSAGNFFTIDELASTTKFGGRKWPYEVLRLAMLTTHYLKPIDFTISALNLAFESIGLWLNIVRLHGAFNRDLICVVPADGIKFLSEDLNTWKYIEYIHLLGRDTTKLDSISKGSGGASLAKMAALIMFLRLFPNKILEKIDGHEFKLGDLVDAINKYNNSDSEAINKIVIARLAARAAKNFVESDRIRDELLSMGIQLKDGKNAITGEPETTWEVKR